MREGEEGLGSDKKKGACDLQSLSICNQPLWEKDKTSEHGIDGWGEAASTVGKGGHVVNTQAE